MDGIYLPNGLTDIILIYDFFIKLLLSYNKIKIILNYSKK